MNRVAIVLDENGCFEGVVADTEIEFFVVQPSCERDRVYRYSNGQFGPQYVQAAFDSRPVGHIDDDILAGGTAYGKEAPSRPKLAIVPPQEMDESEREWTNYQYFISLAHPSTWGSMTLAEWRNAPTNQSVSWEQWCAKHRPGSASAIPSPPES